MAEYLQYTLNQYRILSNKNSELLDLMYGHVTLLRNEIVGSVQFENNLADLRILLGMSKTDKIYLLNMHDCITKSLHNAYQYFHAKRSLANIPQYNGQFNISREVPYNQVLHQPFFYAGDIPLADGFINLQGHQQGEQQQGEQEETEASTSIPTIAQEEVQERYVDLKYKRRRVLQNACNNKNNTSLPLYLNRATHSNSRQNHTGVQTITTDSNLMQPVNADNFKTPEEKAHFRIETEIVAPGLNQEQNAPSTSCQVTEHEQEPKTSKINAAQEVGYGRFLDIKFKHRRTLEQAFNNNNNTSVPSTSCHLTGHEVKATMPKLNIAQEGKKIEQNNMIMPQSLPLNLPRASRPNKNYTKKQKLTSVSDPSQLLNAGIFQSSGKKDRIAVRKEEPGLNSEHAPKTLSLHNSMAQEANSKTLKPNVAQEKAQRTRDHERKKHKRMDPIKKSHVHATNLSPKKCQSQQTLNMTDLKKATLHESHQAEKNNFKRKRTLEQALNNKNNTSVPSISSHLTEHEVKVKMPKINIVYGDLKYKHKLSLNNNCNKQNKMIMPQSLPLNQPRVSGSNNYHTNNQKLTPVSDPSQLLNAGIFKSSGKKDRIAVKKEVPSPKSEHAPKTSTLHNSMAQEANSKRLKPNMVQDKAHRTRDHEGKIHKRMDPIKKSHAHTTNLIPKKCQSHQTLNMTDLKKATLHEAHQAEKNNLKLAKKCPVTKKTKSHLKTPTTRVKVNILYSPPFERLSPSNIKLPDCFQCLNDTYDEYELLHQKEQCKPAQSVNVQDMCDALMNVENNIPPVWIQYRTHNVTDTSDSDHKLLTLSCSVKKNQRQWQKARSEVPSYYVDEQNPQVQTQCPYMGLDPYHNQAECPYVEHILSSCQNQIYKDFNQSMNLHEESNENQNSNEEPNQFQDPEKELNNNKYEVQYEDNK